METEILNTQNSENTQNLPPENNAKKVGKIIVNVLVWLFVAFAVCMTVLALAAQKNEGVPSIGGKCFLTVLTDSMDPTFKPGDLIIGTKLGPVEVFELQEGDVISFWADLDNNGTMEINSHRIVGINLDANGNAVSYKTKGDHNLVADGRAVDVGDVICVWKGGRLKGVGKAINFLQTSTGFLCVIVLPLVILFLYEAFVFIKTVFMVKNDGKKQITAEDEELIKQRAIEEYLKQMQMQNNANVAPQPAVPVETPAETPAENPSPADEQVDTPENKE